MWPLVLLGLAKDKLDIRIQEARMHVPALSPLKPAPAGPAGFASSGMTAPGEFPTAGIAADWINGRPSGRFGFHRREGGHCVAGRKGPDFEETCYRHLISAFWWGESVPLSRGLQCIVDKCHFDLVFDLTIASFNMTRSGMGPGLVLPPTGWRIHPRITSQVSLGGTLVQRKPGFFWFKPLYWATSYVAYRTVFTDFNTTSSASVETFVHPVSRRSRIEGLFGFHLSPLERDSGVTGPVNLNFYPIL